MGSEQSTEKPLTPDERAEVIRKLKIPDTLFKFKVNNKNPRRMKLKMTKMETDHWNELKKAAKPPHIGDGEFARMLFFRGMSAFMEDLVKRVESLTDEEKADIMKEHESLEPAGGGVEIVSKGDLTKGSKTSEISKDGDSDEISAKD